MYNIDTNSKIPLHTQFFEKLKKDILKNYKAGDKLPSLRKMVSIYNLSKTTVESAYSQLYAEGYIESRPQRGYFVSDIKYKEFEINKDDKSINIRTKKEVKYDFEPARLEKDSFPLKTFKRIFNKVLNENLDFGKYNDGQGEEGLRVQISKYLARSRSVNSHCDQVLVTCGFSESLSIIARLLHAYAGVIRTASRFTSGHFAEVDSDS